MSHLEFVIQIAYTTQNDDAVAQNLTINEFKKKSLRTRAALAKDVEDAFQHTGRCLTNWAECVCIDNTYWWPCRLITRRLAGRFSTRLKDKSGYVSVAMFKKELFHVVWINCTCIPLSDWTDEKLISECGEEVINECGEEVIGNRSGKAFCSRLREAYAQAISFSVSVSMLALSMS